MRAAAILALAALSACSHTTRPVVTPLGPSPSERLTAADALVRAGCLDCLIAAYQAYDALRPLPSAKDAATAGVVRAAALIAVRERELGVVDDGYLERARELIANGAALPSWLPTALDIIDALPKSAAGEIRSPTTDDDLERSRRLRQNQAAWSATLLAAAPIDELGSYLWLALTCGSIEARNMTMDEMFAPVATFRDTPLIAFRRAICRGIEAEPLQAVLDRDARFVEVAYYRGLFEVGRRKLDEADQLFDRVYAWRPRWPSLTQRIANIAMTVEEFERASTFYDRTLEMEPRAVDALLGKARALTYLGQYVDSLAVVDQLLALEHWYVGDARYWRALNEAQLERYDEAWTDVELAAKLLINADVPKLAGIIAYRRKQLDVARVKFDQSRERKREDCETGFYLGVVLAEQRVWERSADVFVETGGCLDVAEQTAQSEIEAIRASNDPPARQQRQIAKREQQIANGRRMMATSWFNIAVASYNLSRMTEARRWAEKVVDDEQFGERAREILSRLKNDQ
jgi:tetratricopeptide (TPR) repeat protein